MWSESEALYGSYTTHWSGKAAAYVSPYNENPYMICEKENTEGFITVAYDEVKPIEYFESQLDEYYKKYFADFGEMKRVAKKEYPHIKELCRQEDEKNNKVIKKGEPL